MSFWLDISKSKLKSIMLVKCSGRKKKVYSSITHQLGLFKSKLFQSSKSSLVLDVCFASRVFGWIRVRNMLTTLNLRGWGNILFMIYYDLWGKLVVWILELDKGWGIFHLYIGAIQEIVANFYTFFGHDVDQTLSKLWEWGEIWGRRVTQDWAHSWPKFGWPWTHIIWCMNFETVCFWRGLVGGFSSCRLYFFLLQHSNKIIEFNCDPDISSHISIFIKSVALELISVVSIR